MDFYSKSAFQALVVLTAARKGGRGGGRREQSRARGEGRSQVLPRHDGISAGGYRAIASALDGEVQV